MLFPLLVTLVIVSPVAGFIAAYQCLYLHMPCVGINNVNGLNRVGVELVEDTVGVEVVEDTVGVEVVEDTVGTEVVEDNIIPEQDNNIIFFNNNVIVEQDNNIRIEEVDIGVE